jgi:hypothetical protein
MSERAGKRGAVLAFAAGILSAALLAGGLPAGAAGSPRPVFGSLSYLGLGSDLVGRLGSV